MKVVDDIQQDLTTLSDGVLERVAPAAIAILNALAGVAAEDVLVVVSVEKVQLWRSIASSWLSEVEASESQDSAEWLALRQSVDREFSELIERLLSADS